MVSLEIDKVTSAREMFKDATLLFFEKRSAVSIHHLAHAAHEVLCAITGDNHILDYATLIPEGLKEFKRKFYVSKNFIKHADKDPNATLTLRPEINIFILFDCAWIINLYIDRACVYSQTVIAWCAYVYPELFESENIKSLRDSLTVTFDLQDFDAIAAHFKMYY